MGVAKRKKSQNIRLQPCSGWTLMLCSFILNLAIIFDTKQLCQGTPLNFESVVMGTQNAIENALKK